MLAKTLHSLNFVIIPVIWLLATLISKSIFAYQIIFIVVLINLFILVPKINYKVLLYFSLGLLPAVIAMFLSSYFFAKPVIGITSNLTISLQMSLRLFLLSIISFAFILHARQDKVILYLMQHKILRIRIGYSLLSVSNTFQYLGHEFERIELAYKMRYQRYLYSPKIFIPLLVAAARHAHSLSLSMYNRGLNEKRSFYLYEPRLSIYDYLYILINIIIMLSIFIFIPS